MGGLTARVARYSSKNISCSVKFEFQVNNIFSVKSVSNITRGIVTPTTNVAWDILVLVTNITWDLVMLKKNNLLFIFNSNLTGHHPLFYPVSLLVAIELPFFSGKPS